MRGVLFEFSEVVSSGRIVICVSCTKIDENKDKYIEKRENAILF